MRNLGKGSRGKLIKQLCNCLLALTHSVLQLLEKSKYTVLQENTKIQADVEIDLDALFHLPAALLRKLYLYFNICSHFTAVDWRMHSLLVNINIVLYPIKEAAGPHTELASPLRHLSEAS